MSINTSISASTGLNLDEAPLSLLPEKKRLHSLLMYVLWIAIAAIPAIEGLVYYLTPLADRPYTELHETFKPSGLIGQGLGIIGTLMMVVGVSSYMMRKRLAFMQRFGKLRNWLTFHIFLCTLGPFLVLLHTTFKFGNIASVSFWSMAVVVGSGVFGRYVYVRIPKTINGQFLSPQVIQQVQRTMIARLSKMTNLPADALSGFMDNGKPAGGILGAVSSSFTFELRKRALRQKIEDELRRLGVEDKTREEAVELLMDNAQLQMRMQVMQPFVRAFGYWHVFHIPLALVMLVALLVHIGVAIAFGYTWIW